jgi:hypothetical protein
MNFNFSSTFESLTGLRTQLKVEKLLSTVPVPQNLCYLCQQRQDAAEAVCFKAEKTNLL